MSETAMGRTWIREEDPAWITWRDAITPATRASRRRWALFYPLVLVATAVQAGWGESLGITETFGPSPVPVVLLCVVFGMLRRGTRRLAAVDHPDLDERDQLARASAFRAAYPLLLVVLAASAAFVVFLLPDTDLRDVNVLVGISLWIGLWAIFLPTATLAWGEPDSVAADWEEPARRGGPSELTRDLVLGAGFTAALALEAFGLGALALIPTLCFVAAWVRYRAHQEPISSHIGVFGVVLATLGLVLPVAALLGGTGYTPEAWAASGLVLAVGIAILVAGRRQRRRRKLEPRHPLM